MNHDIHQPATKTFAAGVNLATLPWLFGDVRIRVRDIIRQVCNEMGVTIVNGALSRDHVHLFVEIPPHVSVSQFVQHAKGRSSRKIQQEFEHIRKRYWGQRFGARGYFSTTSGNISDDVKTAYLERHTAPTIGLQPLGVNLPASAGSRSVKK